MRGCTHRTHKRNSHPLKMLPSCLLLLLCLLPLGVLARPQVQPETETGAAVGGRIGTLVSDIYNDIIRSRLKNLLEGVSPSSSPSSPPPSSISSLASTLLESSDALRNRGNGGEEDPLLEVSLPKSVTPIPSELFTSLPGSLFLLFLYLPKISLSQDNLMKTCKKLSFVKKALFLSTAFRSSRNLLFFL